MTTRVPKGEKFVVAEQEYSDSSEQTSEQENFRNERIYSGCSIYNT